MPVQTFHTIKPSIFYIEERGNDTTTPAGALIVGTGFVVDASAGLLATAAHVIEGTVIGNLRLRSTYAASGVYALGNLHKVTAAYVHPEYDLALLKVHPSVTRGRPVLSAGNAPVGTLVTIPGYAHGTELVWIDDILGSGSPKSISPVQSHGYVAARIPDDGIQTLNVYAYDCTTYPGQSGSPVIDVANRSMIGVHTHGFRGSMGYGIAVDLLLKFLAEVIDEEPAKKPVGSVSSLLDLECSNATAQDSRNPEKDLKLGGRKWRIIKNDADPLPSNPHAHLLGTRYKLHLGTGHLYQRSNVVGKITKSELTDLRSAAEDAGITLPPLLV